ncbi:MAG: hypothetical protein Q9162_003365 [Coniocarpon cinnabarinum]
MSLTPYESNNVGAVFAQRTDFNDAQNQRHEISTSPISESSTAPSSFSTISIDNHCAEQPLITAQLGRLHTRSNISRQLDALAATQAAQEYVRRAEQRARRLLDLGTARLSQCILLGVENDIIPPTAERTETLFSSADKSTAVTSLRGLLAGNTKSSEAKRLVQEVNAECELLMMEQVSTQPEAVNNDSASEVSSNGPVIEDETNKTRTALQRIRWTVPTQPVKQQQQCTQFEIVCKEVKRRECQVFDG